MNETRIMTPLVILIAILGCKDEGVPPPGYQPTIELSLEDYGTTDAWLRVRFTNAPPYAFWLVRDGANVFDGSSSVADTLVADDPLLPNRSYTYKAYRLSGTAVVDSSETVQVTTLDSTSSAWQWAIDTLGVMNSYLLDCAIIAPDNIWVVGQIYARDSLGNVEDVPHNAARWDGTRWNLMRIQFFTICGQPSRTPYPASSVVAFDSTDVWIAMDGDQVARWNGSAQSATMCLPSSSSIRTLWGRNPNSVYAVGSGGNIAFYNGSTWQRQESGTTLFLSDVLGKSADNVYVSGKSPTVGGGVVLKKSGQTWQTMIVSESFDTTGFLQTKLYGVIDGLWEDERGTLYTVGNLMFQHKHGRWDYLRSLPGNCLGCNPNFLHNGYLHAVRGNFSNDIIIAGEINTVRHFNGVSWIGLGLPYYPLKHNIFWYACDMRGGVAVVAGDDASTSRALVLRLWR